MVKVKKRHKVLRILFVIVVLMIAYVGSSLYLSRYYLRTTTYQYDSDKISEPIDILVLTDQHANNFGKDNSRLVKYVKKQSPDLVLIVGDALNFYSKNDDFVVNLVTSLSQLCPVYYAPGNHEFAYYNSQKIKADTYASKLTAAGAIYLDQDYIDVTIKNQGIRIGGLYDYVYNNNNVPAEQYHQKDSYQFLLDYTNTNAFKLMMTHRPESYVTDDEDAKWPIDLALCGHEHGGQVRAPFIGGFFSTHLGWFSEYLDGFHMINGIPVIISQGLGTYYSKKTPPRFNNLPEIVKIELT